MIVNDIQVVVQDADGNDLREVDHHIRVNPEEDMSGDRANKCYIQVTPGAAFQVKVSLPPTFHFKTYRSASIRCDIDGGTVNYHTGNHIYEGADPLEWLAWSGYIPLEERGGASTIDFAFGREMNVPQHQEETPEHFNEKGTIEVTVVCGPMREVLEFDYAVAEIPEKNGILKSNLGPMTKPADSVSRRKSI